MSTAVFVEVNVKEESIDELKTMLSNILGDTRRFEGCQSVDIWQNQDEPTNFVFYELWDNRSSYEKYLAWREETGFLDQLGPMLAGPPSIRYYDNVDV